MDAINEPLQSKLQSLASFLGEITGNLEAIAEEIEYDNLKTAMMALSAESKQYAKEIRGQLYQHNITVPTKNTDQLLEQFETTLYEQTHVSRGGEIIAICNIYETCFNSLYEDLLTEYFPYKYFKDIIICQFYSTQSALRKIRLLNTLRFRN